MTWLWAVLLPLAGWAATVQIDVDLTRLGQFGDSAPNKSNLGETYRPIDTSGQDAGIELSAWSNIDQNNPYAPVIPGQSQFVYEVGTVSYETQKGFGVQSDSGGGSHGLSGAGGNQNEELVVTYDAPVALSTIGAIINELEFGSHSYDVDGANQDKDDPFIFLFTVELGILTLSELDIKNAFEFLNGDPGTKSGILDFGNFAGLFGLTGDSLINAYALRETHGEIFIAGLTTGSMVVPEPSLLLILSSFLGISFYLQQKQGKSRQPVSAGPAGSHAHAG